MIFNKGKIRIDVYQEFLDMVKSAIAYKYRARTLFSGMTSDLFFMKHSEPENSHSESHSKSNLFEAQFVVRLAVHLRKQSYAPDEVTILATYRGQVSHSK